MVNRVTIEKHFLSLYNASEGHNKIKLFHLTEIVVSNRRPTIPKGPAGGGAFTGSHVGSAEEGLQTTAPPRASALCTASRSSDWASHPQPPPRRNAGIMAHERSQVYPPPLWDLGCSVTWVTLPHSVEEKIYKNGRLKERPFLLLTFTKLPKRGVYTLFREVDC